jgi:hypothetical protein
VIPYALDPEDATGGITPFLPHSLTGTLLTGFPFFGGVFALMLGVFALGSEYGWGTLKTLFTQGPSRQTVFVAKLAALGIVLIPFVLVLFAAGAVTSVVIARIEDAPIDFPSAWLLVRALAAGWLMLAVWGALGVLLGVLTRGTSLAIGIGILYALVIEGLLSALTDAVGVLEPLSQVFLRPTATRSPRRSARPPTTSGPTGRARSAGRSWPVGRGSGCCWPSSSCSRAGPAGCSSGETWHEGT